MFSFGIPEIGRGGQCLKEKFWGEVVPESVNISVSRKYKKPTQAKSIDCMTSQELMQKINDWGEYLSFMMTAGKFSDQLMGKLIGYRIFPNPFLIF